MAWRSLAIVVLLLVPSVAMAQDLLHEVTAEALLMRRSPSASQPLTGLVDQWNVVDMHFDYEVGPRLSVIRHFDCPVSLEVNYFGIYNQGATKTRSNNLVSIIGPGFTYSSLLAQPYNFVYESDLHSLELNLRRSWGESLTVLAGFRWVELSEDFDHIGNTTPVYSIDTNNQLFGFQIGAEQPLLSEEVAGIQIDGFAKAGIFGNSADGAAASTGAFGTPAGTAAASDDGTAFVGEAGLVGLLRLRDNLYVRGGYQALWLDGVATAPNQLPTFNTPAGTATLNTSFSAFYHGGFLGLGGEF